MLEERERRKMTQAGATDWLGNLGKDIRGSRPRCVLLTHGDAGTVAQRLTDIVGRCDVRVAPDDQWQPKGKMHVREAQLDKTLESGGTLLSGRTRQQLREWWLAVGRSRARTPNWDIASTCTVSGTTGVLLVEAKAHKHELSNRDKCGAAGDNRAKIDHALVEATASLRNVTGGAWQLSSEHHYQLSNRFAWSWKIASLGVSVVLLYLGFLKARDMSGPLFQSEADWRAALMEYGRGVVDETCWETTLDVQGTPLLLLVRVVEQPLRTNHSSGA